MIEVRLAKLFWSLGIALALLFVVTFFVLRPQKFSTVDDEKDAVVLESTSSSSPDGTPHLDHKESFDDLRTVKLLFAGDLMFDRHIRQYAEENGNDYIFELLKDELQKPDIVIANLEGPITDSPSRSVDSKIGSTNNFIFTFDPTLATTLASHNIMLVNLGNNHILNFGLEGLSQTISYLTEGGIDYFGNVGTEEGRRTTVLDFEDRSIGFVNYNQFVAGGQEAAFQDIEKIKQDVDIVILYAHWGLEYQQEANQVIQNLAHQFIDVGVDLIIGSHPHVVQQSEQYQGKTIYYSLGNFIFDQYFSEAVQNGLLVKVKIDLETLEMVFDEVKIKMEQSGQTVVKQ